MCGCGAKFFLAVSAVVAALVAYRISLGDPEPETMPEDVWWGPGKSATGDNTDIRPFRINVTDQVIGDLKNRLSNFRPSARPLENVKFEYGFNGDRLSEIVDHWANRYDWPVRQAYLNSMPQFKTTVYGLGVHFLHVRPAAGANVRAVPLLLLHGWPGSVVEFYKMIPLLTEARHGFAFEVIAPSLPGYGFSDAAVRPGMGPAQVGQVFVKLMERLGHDKFYVQGGDWVAIIAESNAKLFPDRVYSMHSNLCFMGPALTLCDIIRLVLGIYWPSLIVSSETEKLNTYPLSNLLSFLLEESGYFHLQMTKPDTAGVALNDSPAGLAAYVLEKFSTRTNSNNKHLPDDGLSKYNIDELLDNMRFYAEFGSKTYRDLPHIKAKVKIPTACAVFPLEIPITLSLKKLLKRKFTNLVKVTEMKEGGHFGAFEQPKLLAEDIWSSISKMEKNRN